MSRDPFIINPYDKKRNEKSAALNLARAILKETRRVTRKEDLFPKRARWQGCYQIMQIALNLHTAVAYANGIRVETHGLMVERYSAQAAAISWAYTLDAALSAIQDDLDVNANKLETLIDMVNEAGRVLRAWQTADRKRHEPQFGSLTAEELGEPAIIRLRWF